MFVIGLAGLIISLFYVRFGEIMAISFRIGDVLDPLLMLKNDI